jgi:GntR family transcriptional regulator
VPANADRARKHQRIADDLRARIRSGELADGDRLPGENALMESYGVARMTARHALADLQNEGIAVARKGSGVFVRSFRPVRRHGNRRLSRDVWGAGSSMWDADGSQGPVVVDQLVVDERPASDEVARLLDVPPGSPVVVRRRRYVVNEEPVQLATAYIPARFAAGTPIAATDTGAGGIYARLADLGVPPVRFTEELHARMPTHEEATRLQLTSGTPVICIVRTAFASAGQPVELSEMTLSAASYVLHYEFDA